jgi:hypothetical protein
MMWPWFRPKRLQPLIDRIAQLEVENTILRDRSQRYREELETVAASIKPLVDAVDKAQLVEGGIVKIQWNPNLSFRLRFAKHYCAKFDYPATKNS